MNYKIIPLNLGEAELMEKSKFTYMKNFGERLIYPYIAWLIVGGSKTILVDSGPGTPEWVEKHRKGRKIQPGPLGDLPSTLKTYGIEPKEIELVVCSHLHWDHCCDNYLFPNAKFLVQHKELTHAVAPVFHQRFDYQWTENENPPFLKVANKYQTIKGDKEILPGVSVLHTPGHTPGVQSVLVKTKSGNILLAGDCIPLFENWDTRTPSGIHVDLEEYEATFEKIDSLNDVLVLPGHDMRVFEKRQYP